MSQHAFNLLFGELMEAGADTTANQILTLVLALAKNPHVQAKARKELDAVCGTERAPLFSDFARLPYINATIKEGLRWRPTSDLGLSHTVTRDDYYNGMFVPKGSTIFVGVWAMHMDEQYYPDRDTFNPDRVLEQSSKLANDFAVGPDYAHRDHYGYGAGRHICPGMHLVERSMWRITAKLLWTRSRAKYSLSTRTPTHRPTWCVHCSSMCASRHAARHMWTLSRESWRAPKSFWRSTIRWRRGLRDEEEKKQDCCI